MLVICSGHAEICSAFLKIVAGRQSHYLKDRDGVGSLSSKQQSEVVFFYHEFYVQAQLIFSLFKMSGLHPVGWDNASRLG